jgi:hypothetical protein
LIENSRKTHRTTLITDYRQEPVCILPAGFHLEDTRREQIWARYEKNGASLTHDDQRELFPNEPAPQNARL